ncbi:MAG: hypothetical protein ABJB34_07695, partial [Acidobacteriota bacterium]
PQYMSPEQATGDRVIDGRSDIYSLGAMLYEMLAGEPPHVGGTVQATIAKVITDPVRPLRSLRETVPVQIELAVGKALAKLPADRFATASLFVRALEGDRTGLISAEPGGLTSRRPWLRHPATLALAAALLATSGIAAYKARPAAAGETNARTVRFDFVPAAGAKVRLTFGPAIAMSPDGRLLAYVGEAPHGSQLWIRDLQSGISHALPGTDEPDGPGFSSDGRWLVFRTSSRAMLEKVSVEGGPVQALYPMTSPGSVAFFAGDSLLFSVASGLTTSDHIFSGSLAGGTAKQFLLNDSTAESAVQFGPLIGPDNNTVFFASNKANENLGSVIGWATRSERVAFPTDVQAKFIIGYAAGYIIYGNDADAIMAVPFDLATHKITGQPITTGENAMGDAYATKAALSPAGDLAFVVGGGPVRPMLVNKSGSTPLMVSERAIADARYSPDGSRIAFSIHDAGRTDIWIYTISSGGLDRLTTAGAVNDRVEWSPDGRRVIYRTDRNGPTSLWWQTIDGSLPAERISPAGLNVPVFEGVITPDGKTLVFRIDTPNRLRDIMSVSMSGDKTITPVLATDADELTPRISPDGKWMAYVSAESGEDEVYVRPFPGAGGRTLISVNGGREPLWAKDGRMIFYSANGAYLAASVTLSATPLVSRRDTVAKGNYASMRFHPLYDIAPDGKHLLVLEPSQTDVPATVILNWASAFAARVAATK